MEVSIIAADVTEGATRGRAKDTILVLVEGKASRNKYRLPSRSRRLSTKRRLHLSVIENLEPVDHRSGGLGLDVDQIALRIELDSRSRLLGADLVNLSTK